MTPVHRGEPVPRSFRPAVLIAAVLLAPAVLAAQTLFQGRIDVTVQDPQQNVVPGAMVEIGGPASQQQTTDASGEAHFLNLPPGVYTVSVTVQGFTPYRNENVRVAAGGGVPLRASLQVGSVTETVQVVREAPVVDPERQTLTTGISYEELQELPSARDPWVVLQTIPAVVVDRVNVGGAESGQQSNYIAKGATGFDNTWNLDGIPVTDLAATGSSPTYYNFDMFEEMSVTTGGASATNPTPGVQLNMQFRSASDELRGAAHVYGANESLQSTNLPDDLRDLAGESGKGNRLDELTDVGFDVGGPVLRNRWWAWGSYGRTESTLFTLTGDPDATTLENYAFKTHAQITPRIRPEFLFFRGNKEKQGRGASPLRAPASTWNQSGPTPLYKGQVNVVAGGNLFVTATSGTASASHRRAGWRRPRTAMPSACGAVRSTSTRRTGRTTARSPMRRGCAAGTRSPSGAAGGGRETTSGSNIRGTASTACTRPITPRPGPSRRGCGGRSSRPARP
jgi:hypothetical protein